MTQYYDAETGWTQSECSIEEALQSIRDDGRVTVRSDVRVGPVRVVHGDCDGDEFVLVSAE